MRDTGPVEIVANAEPVRLGSFLLTIVEPHRGYEVAYNRWYERDHLYSGCMIGPYNFAARRFVATADLKKLRDPDPSEITGEPYRGSYLALYWILDGYGDIWGKWAGQQVMQLHEAGRMFAEREHVHTALYDVTGEVRTHADGVPAELALDHPYAGLVAEFADRTAGVTREDLDGWLRTEHLPGALGGASLGDAPTGLVVIARPQEMRAHAPGVEPREAADEKVLLLWFLDTHPAEAWPAFVAHRKAMESAGMAQVRAILPFIPTVPGTDTYTDRLWVG